MSVCPYWCPSIFDPNKFGFLLRLPPPMKPEMRWICLLTVVLSCASRFVQARFTLKAISLPASEYDALQDLYNATNGAEWRWREVGDKWQFSTYVDPCTSNWQGIECTVVSMPAPATYHISSLTLSSYNLQGFLPSSLSNLTKLITLDLSENAITGSIPASFGRFASQQQLTLSSNSLTGPLPPSMAGVTTLTSMLITDNQLSGPLPATFNQLTNLQQVELFHNSLTSTIPDLSTLQQLQILNLEFNNIRGTIPASLGALTQLQQLFLNHNSLRGSIPEALYSLTQLTELYLGNNLLTGSIPEFNGKLGQLLDLDLQGNHLEGSIPASVNSLVLCEYFNVESNYLTGTIPDTLCTLQHATYVNVNNNLINGTIPSNIYNLTSASDIYFGINLLTGSIPDTIGQLPSIILLEMTYNSLTGHIPDSFGALSTLLYAELNNNQLSGPIPDSVANLSRCLELALSVNHLSGTITNAIGNMTELRVLAIDNNHLHGSVPNSLSTLVHLSGLVIDTNALTGTIPEWVGSFDIESLYINNNGFTGTLPSNIVSHSTAYLDASYNKFTGPLPISLGSAVLMRDIQMASNLFTGAIPYAMGYLPLLQELELSDNLLSGPLPDSFGSLHALQQLYIGNNRLSGALPHTLHNLTQLLILSAQSNRFVGPLSGVFNVTQRRLQTIQIENNQFTGTLPAELFRLSSLISVQMVGTCMHGTLPSTICHAKNLEALILYGLSTGSYCRDKYAYGFSAEHAFGGSFPSCMLEMPQLTTLLLSSNRLTGKLDRAAELNNRLIELDLSHNLLTGNIPDNIQNHTWVLLDLSHNKLNGVLKSTLFSKTTLPLNITVAPPALSLTSNRLSGTVPRSVQTLTNVSILAGNVFQCRYDKSNLPQQDESLDRYECASDSFDISLYVWLGLVVLSFVMVIVVYRSQVNFGNMFPALEVASEHVSRLAHMYSVFELYKRMVRVGWYCAGFVLVVLLPVYVALSYYAGTHTYQYAYVVSAIFTSGVTAFVLYFIAWFGLLLVFALGVRAICTSSATMTEKQSLGAGDRMFVYVAYSAVNIVVVLGVNVAFVYIVLYRSSQAQTIAQIALSVFKLTWNTVCAPSLIRRLTARQYMGNNDTRAETYFELQLVIALFNNIIIPCLVVAAIDPNCFSDVLLPPDSSTVNYLYPTCESAIIGAPCLQTYYTPASLTFTPSFTYSYQCSASFITSYAPAFIYMCISTVFVSPVLRYMLVRWYNTVTSNTTLHTTVSWLIPRIYKLPKADTPMPADSARSSIVRVTITLVNILTHIAILLTFGAVFPPVALAMAVSITAVVYFALCNTQRFIHAAIGAQQYEYLDIVDVECVNGGSHAQLIPAARIVIAFCCVFYALFLFDTLGDAQGFAAAAWVLIVVPCAPLVAYGVYDLCSTYTKPPVERTESSVGTEMGTIGEAEKDNQTTVNVLHDSSA